MWGSGPMAAERNSKPGIVALAWLLNRPGVTMPFASATNEDLLAAAKFELDASIERLNEGSAPLSE
jgi:aryl-alcohol dehydrogenase-like predicted oxidoreductase